MQNLSYTTVKDCRGGLSQPVHGDGDQRHWRRRHNVLTDELGLDRIDAESPRSA